MFKNLTLSHSHSLDFNFFMTLVKIENFAPNLLMELQFTCTKLNKSPWFLLDGENIVKYDENTPNGRVLFFSTKESLKIMSRAKSLGVDGTFKICPDL